MPNAPDMENERTDRWAMDLAARTPAEMVPELADAGPWWPWHTAEPIVRQVFRERLRVFLTGDTSVLPPERAMHQKGNEGVGLDVQPNPPAASRPA